MSASDHPNVNRLKSILETIHYKIDELQNVKLFGVWKKDFKDFYKDIFEAIASDINKLLNNSERIEHGTKTGMLRDYCVKLEVVIFEFDKIINSESKHSPLHEFVSYIMRELKQSEKIHYLICSGSILYTIKLIEFLKFKLYGVYFANLHSILEKYRTKYNDFFIIYIPPLIVTTKPYWSVIAHETGHMIIDIHDLVGPTYKKVTSKTKINTPEFRNYWNSIEYVSDFIANACMGPVFYDILFELLYTLNIQLIGTHPPWDSRLNFLKTQLTDINKDNKIESQYQNQIDNPEAPYTNIQKIDEIISRTKQKVFEAEKVTFYSKNEAELDKASKNLSELTPYIGPPNVLLNSYWQNKNTVIDNVKKILDETNYKNTEKQVGLIVEESIRLTNMQETFCRMVS